MTLVLDCSVVFGFVFKDERTPYAMRVAESLKTESAIVPAIFPLETVNVLRTQEKRGRWTTADSNHFLSLLSALPITVEESPAMHETHTLLALARRHDLSSYDASYLALAVTQQASLATQDAALRKAAQKEKMFFE